MTTRQEWSETNRRKLPANMVSVAEALTIGTRHQQAGQFAQAEQIYRQILQLEPHNPQALHLLGTLALQAGQPATAVQLMASAVRNDPTQPAFHASLGDALGRAGNFDEALKSFRAALQLAPNYAPAHTYLGVLLHRHGKLRDAAASFREVVRLAPDDPQARANLGRVLYDLGEFAESEVSYRRALRVTPQVAGAHFNLGSVLHAQSKWREAQAEFEAALALDPKDPVTHLNLGNTLQELHAPQDAERHFRRSIELDANYASAYHNLGTLLEQQGRWDEALQALQTSVRLEPTLVYAQSSLGAMLGARGQLEEAVAHCETALRLNPTFAAAYNNLGTFYQSLGRIDDALASFRKAVELDPRATDAYSNYLYSLNYHPKFDPATIFAEHRAWAERHADPLFDVRGAHANDRSPGRRLRLGYLSSFFREHAVNTFVEPILACHDHAQFEVFCYADSHQVDATSERLRAYADHWQQVVDRDDAALAERIRGDAIDILVDVTGHIAGGRRLLVFARKPAPVQVTYIGYQNTTGMRAMDYRLTDAYADPPGQTDAYYTEKLVRLPKSYFCYGAPSDAPDVGPLPASEKGYVTFGSFNNVAKVTPWVLAAWAEILRRAPTARLMLLGHDVPSLGRYMRETFERHGIAPDRIEMASRGPYDHYLRQITRVDLALDPFPFNGHTTTCDCLWLGVPVVSLAGATYVSRFGSSALVNLGLDDLIASSTEQYIDVAARLAGDLERLKNLRATLRERMRQSVIVDAPGFTRNLEAAYRAMWQNWCA